MDIPNEFFTVTSFGTLAGATAAVYLVTSGLGQFMTAEKGLKYKKYISLGLSLVFAFIAASLVSDKTPWIWVVALVNGFLINFTSVGLNSVTRAAPAGGETTTGTTLLMAKGVGKMKAKPSTARGKFLDPWW